MGSNLDRCLYAAWGGDSNGHVRQVDAAVRHDPDATGSVNRAVGVSHDGVGWVADKGLRSIRLGDFPR